MNHCYQCKCDISNVVIHNLSTAHYDQIMFDEAVKKTQFLNFTNHPFTKTPAYKFLIRTLDIGVKK